MITVLGIGNILLSDEGLGVRTVEELQRRYEFPENVKVLDGGTLGIDLLYHIEGTEKLLIIDAVLGGKKPGTFYKIKNENVKKYFKSKVSMHELGIQEVLALLEVLEKPIKEIVVLGLEPKSLEVSTELTPEIQEKIPLLVEEALSQLKEWGVEVKEKSHEQC
ncbi:HyaD/HybD family hydrogenase maturation endopeptidase [Aquifex aeolicus]|uniref:HupD hydrogenase related function n=1 Tax=Aquifex aeolicus (strain VF5) TaxID=224324 RepID=O66898_AQUAE|nr:HyaD/HybD family hydrogenase maturation endopeptidase [Aquifex aeolicus]AAC06858.1 HupD hydrogenase related function [Aquifex aeolicus VF5]